MKNIFVLIALTIIQLGFSQEKVDLPFVGSRSFSLCEGNACESEIIISSNGNCKIIIYGFMRDEKTIEYNGKYKPIMWIYENGKKAYGYTIVGKNTIFQIGLDGKVKKDCFDHQVCKSFLYYVDKNGNVKY